MMEAEVNIAVYNFAQKKKFINSWMAVLLQPYFYSRIVAQINLYFENFQNMGVRFL